jgi:hypothetical protein
MDLVWLHTDLHSVESKLSNCLAIELQRIVDFQDIALGS